MNKRLLKKKKGKLMVQQHSMVIRPVFIVCLLIVSLISQSVCADEEKMFHFTVQKGDKLINICKEYLEDPGKWPEIAKINHIPNPHKISPGTPLKIPVRLLKGDPLDGETTFIKGEVLYRLKGGKEWLPLQLGDRVRQGSWIKTGAESKVEVSYEDGSSFFVWSDTTIEVTASEEKRSTSHVFRDLFIDAGRIITKIKNVLGNKSSFETHTRTAVLGVRGTEFRVSVDSADATRSEVLKGTVKAQAMDEDVLVQAGEGTLIRKDEPPSAPQKLLLPPVLSDLKSAYKTLPLEFKFEKIEDAVSYRIMLARDAEFKDVVREHLIKPDQILSLEGLEDGTYYLQSRSVDHLGLEGIPSEPALIHLRVNPVPPFVDSPVSGAEYWRKPIEFKWLKVKDAVAYHIQTASDEEFKIITEDRTDIKDTAYTTGNLDFGTYYFRICSVANDRYEGGWSDILSFMMIPPPPVPALEAPELDEETVTIRWKKLGAGTTYHFQMATDEAFNNIRIDEKLDIPEISFPTPRTGLYYVRTRGIDDSGREGDFSPPQAIEIQPKPVLILADVSGSMKEDMEIYRDEGGRKKDMTKVRAEKELLLKLSRELSSMPCHTGIYQVRYISGDADRYEQFLPIGDYELYQMQDHIEEKFFTDYSAFNRRTPLADMFRQLDEQELGQMKGRIKLVLISDGKESFYNLEDDDGPLSEIRRLKEKYGAAFTFYTIFMGQKEKEDEDDRGENLLKQMASAGQGTYFSGVKLLEDESLHTELCALLCGEEKEDEDAEASREESAKLISGTVSKPETGAEKTPGDRDGDGVYDPADRCPGTPRGAKVNAYGCWVLEGIVFDYDKWDIRPEFYPSLDEAATVLKKNPDLKVEIQGHTDNTGSAEYNQRLSEKRARSVMEYFLKKGVEPERLSSAGYGFTKPVTSNRTPEGRAMNRRVELKIEN
jgi:outer membrane protein OmpA-like peptidoglycan-associated protein